MITVNGIPLPNKPLSDHEINATVKKIHIPTFRGVFLRDTLPSKPKAIECGILNLDSSSGRGTHWVAWYKDKAKKYYFDSYGIQPPIELIEYLRPPVLYSTEKLQSNGEVFCGHVCLYVLKQLSLGLPFQDIVNKLH